MKKNILISIVIMALAVLAAWPVDAAQDRRDKKLAEHSIGGGGGYTSAIFSWVMAYTIDNIEETHNPGDYVFVNTTTHYYPSPDGKYKVWEEATLIHGAKAKDPCGYQSACYYLGREVIW